MKLTSALRAVRSFAADSGSVNPLARHAAGDHPSLFSAIRNSQPRLETTNVFSEVLGEQLSSFRRFKGFQRVVGFTIVRVALRERSTPKRQFCSENIGPEIPVRKLLARSLALSASALTLAQFPWAFMLRLADLASLNESIETLRQIPQLPTQQLVLSGMGLAVIAIWVYLERRTTLLEPGGTISPERVAAFYVRELLEGYERKRFNEEYRPLVMEIVEAPDQVGPRERYHDVMQLLKRERHILLTGAAGSGKSTTLDRAATMYAERVQQMLGAAGHVQGPRAIDAIVPIPIRVNVARLDRALDTLALKLSFGPSAQTATKRRAFLNAIQEQFDGIDPVSGIDKALPEWIANGNVAWLIDGLDEVPATRLAGIVELLRSEALTRNHQSDLVICCRTEFLRTLPASILQQLSGCVHVALQPLTDDQVLEWLSADRHRDLRGVLFTDPALAAVAKSPFALSVLMRIPSLQMSTARDSDAPLDVRQSILRQYVEEISRVGGYSIAEIHNWLGELARLVDVSQRVAPDFTRLPQHDRPDAKVALAAALGTVLIVATTYLIGGFNIVALAIAALGGAMASLLIAGAPMLKATLQRTGTAGAFADFATGPGNRVMRFVGGTFLKNFKSKWLSGNWTFINSLINLIVSTGGILALLSMFGTLLSVVQTQVRISSWLGALVVCAFLFPTPSVMELRLALPRLGGAAAMVVMLWLGAPAFAVLILAVALLRLVQPEVPGIVVAAIVFSVGTWINGLIGGTPAVSAVHLAAGMSFALGFAAMQTVEWITESSSGAVLLSLLVSGATLFFVQWWGFDTAFLILALCSFGAVGPLVWPPTILIRVWETWGHRYLIRPLSLALLVPLRVAPFRQGSFFQHCERNRLLTREGDGVAWSHTIWRNYFIMYFLLRDGESFGNASKYLFHGQEVLMEVVQSGGPSRRARALSALCDVFKQRGVAHPIETARRLRLVSAKYPEVANDALSTMQVMVATMRELSIDDTFPLLAVVSEAAIVAGQAQQRDQLEQLLALGLPMADRWTTDASQFERLIRLLSAPALGWRIIESPTATLVGFYTLGANIAREDNDPHREDLYRNRAERAAALGRQFR